MNARVVRLFACAVVAGGVNPVSADIRICPYYDNRKCAVVWTGDDLSGSAGSYNLPYFDQAVKAAEANKIVFTAGVIASGLTTNDWKTVQQWYQNGAFSIASHSVCHIYLSPWVAEQNIEYETAASQDKITRWLELPSWNRYRGRQFMTAWIQPSGTAPEPQESEFRRQLGLHGFLSDRKSGLGGNTSWDSANGLFSRISANGFEVWSLQQNNEAFDQCYNSGQVFHIYNHPATYQITNGSPLEAHMKYIGGRKDVWYSGFQYVYDYKYLQSINPPSLTILASDAQRITFGAQADSAARSKYGLSYPLTYRVDIPADWTGVYVFYSDAGNPEPVRLAEMTANDFFNGLNVFRKDTSQHVVYVSQAFPEYEDSFQIFVINADGDFDGDGVPNRQETTGTAMLTPL